MPHGGELSVSLRSEGVEARLCVGDTLDALAGEAPGPGDPGDAHRRRLDGGQHAPAGAGLAGRSRQRIAGGPEGALEAEHEHGEPAHGLACRRPHLIDSMLSF